MNRSIINKLIRLIIIKKCHAYGLDLNDSVEFFQKVYIYIYMYIYMYSYFWRHFFIDTYLIDHTRHFCLHIFFISPFELPYWSYDIRRELVDKSSIISYFSSTFCPTSGHHQGRMYYKRDVTFVCTLLLCKKSVCTVVLWSVYFSNLFHKWRQ